VFRTYLDILIYFFDSGDPSVGMAGVMVPEYCQMLHP